MKAKEEISLNVGKHCNELKIIFWSIQFGLTLTSYVIGIPPFEELSPSTLVKKLTGSVFSPNGKH